MSPNINTPLELARTEFEAMETGDLDLVRASIHPESVNHEAANEPPATQQPGPPGFLATSAWLRLAFSDLHFEIHDVLSEGPKSIAYVTMSGRQTGPFVVFPAGQAPVAFPPTGAAFSVRQCHMFTTKDGLHIEHAAVRDDLTMMTQLGHLPPSPRAMARMAGWVVRGGARRAIREAIAVSAEASRLA